MEAKLLGDADREVCTQLDTLEQVNDLRSECVNMLAEHNKQIAQMVNEVSAQQAESVINCTQKLILNLFEPLFADRSERSSGPVLVPVAPDPPMSPASPVAPGPCPVPEAPVPSFLAAPGPSVSPVLLPVPDPSGSQGLNTPATEDAQELIYYNLLDRKSVV